MEVDEQNKPNPLGTSATATQTNSITPMNKHHQYEEEKKEEKEQLFPPGYRFCPYDNELIFYYLKKKILNLPLPHNKIKDVNLYTHNPEHLAACYPVLGDKDWYFFTPRDRKYRNGNRPNRAAGDGYWKATGADKKIEHKGELIGLKKALVFYLGKAPRGEKTNWIMHEYRILEAKPRTKKSENDMRLDDWVLCKIYQKEEKNKSKKNEQEDQGDSGRHSPILSEECNIPPALVDDIAQMSGDYINAIANSSSHINVGNDFIQPPLAPPQITLFPDIYPSDNINHFGAHHLHVHLPMSLNYEAQQFGLGHHLGHSNENGLDIVPRRLQQDYLNIPNVSNYGVPQADPSMHSLLDQENYFQPGSGLDNFLRFDGSNSPPS
ncbi:NAC transcription factor 32 like [Actinidia chinensis var. chinensis]|uniref:NAC transcription factor 32 like n=1 Tax=Actinidia chinensis var. chinensis TaxID=1590841 RepID=A0A2R6PFL6_ACTCC|nr:NAC transcription factor 32 like [Actinidia chinensis var. chinensis]